MLVALYEATDGANWSNSTNWLTDRPIGEWYGVTTDDVGRVTSLQLRENRLSGSIPAELGRLGGLGVLEISSNHLSGPIPPELGRLSGLGVLNLSLNRLNGPVPMELGDLANLRVLGIGGNELSGCIPASLSSVRQLGGPGLSFCGPSVARPASAPAAEASPTAAPTPPGGVRPETAVVIARYGLRLASPVPQLVPPEGDPRFGWRFPEPPVWGSPHAPFLLLDGVAVDEAEPWMTASAADIIRAFDRYHGTVMSPASVGEGSALAELLTPDYAAVRQGGANATEAGSDWPSYDYGLVVIDLANRNLARTYAWTFGAGEEASGGPYTDHVISEWWRTDTGWLLAHHWSAAVAVDGNTSAESLILSAGGQFLPFFELVFGARAALGLPDVIAGDAGGE